LCKIVSSENKAWFKAVGDSINLYIKAQQIHKQHYKDGY